MKTKLSEPGYDRIPEDMRRRLEEALARVRRILRVRGILAVTATAAGLLLALMLLDASIALMPWGIRIGLSATAVALVLFTAWRQLYVPLRRRLDLTAIAQIIDKRHPELEERISSTVELLSTDLGADLRGSARLVSLLAREAMQDVGGVNPKIEFTVRTVRPYLYAAIACAMILLTALAARPRHTIRLLARAVVPYADIGNVLAVHMKVEPGDTAVPRGDELAVRVSISNLDVDHAYIQRTGIDGERATERLSREESTGEDEVLWTITFPQVMDTFRYRIRAGRALSGHYRVDVVDRPRVERIAVRYDLPGYTGLGSVEEPDLEGDIAALAGTRVMLSAYPSRAVRSSDMFVGDVPLPGRIDRKERGRSVSTWMFTLKSGQEDEWRIDLKDLNGFDNRFEARRIRAEEDSPPTVALLQPPERDVSLGPGVLLPMRYEARDDFAVKETALMVSVDGGEPVIVELEAPQRAADHAVWSGRAVLDLAAPEYAGAAVVTARLRVGDNLPASRDGPQYGFSEILTLRMGGTARSLTEQRLVKIEQALLADLQSAIGNLERAVQAVPKDNLLDKEGLLADDLQTTFAGVESELAAAERALQEASRLAAESIYRDVSPGVDTVIREQVAPARQNTQVVRLTEDPLQRTRAAGEIRKNVDEATRRLREMVENMAVGRRRAELLARIDALAQEEFRLAQKAAELKAREDMDEVEAQAWKDKQDELVRALGELLRREQTSLQNQMDRQLNSARDLEQQSADSAARQRELNEMAERAAGDDREDASELLALRLAERQRRLAAEMDQLERRADREGDSRAAKAAKKAERSARKSASSLAKNKAARAARQAKEAAEKMRDLKQEDGTDPELTEKAEELAEKQDALREQMEALAEDRLDEVVDAMQKDLEQEVSELKEKAEKLAKRQERLSGEDEQSKEDAVEALELLAKAENKLKEAREKDESKTDSKKPSGEKSPAQDDAEMEEDKQDDAEAKAEEKAEQPPQEPKPPTPPLIPPEGPPPPMEPTPPGPGNAETDPEKPLEFGGKNPSGGNKLTPSTMPMAGAGPPVDLPEVPPMPKPDQQGAEAGPQEEQKSAKKDREEAEDALEKAADAFDRMEKELTDSGSMETDMDPKGAPNENMQGGESEGEGGGLSEAEGSEGESDGESEGEPESESEAGGEEGDSGEESSAEGESEDGESEGQGDGDEMSEALSESFDDASDAADAESLADAEEAASEAAENLSDMAQSAAGSPSGGKGGKPGGGDKPAVGRDPDADEEDSILTEGEWARLQGRATGRVSGAEKVSTPPGYRDLVRDYFRELSRRGADSNNVKENE